MHARLPVAAPIQEISWFAPLDIHVVEVHELIHDNVRARSTVKDITDNVKAVHCQVLDQVAECHDELVTISMSMMEWMISS